MRLRGLRAAISIRIKDKSYKNTSTFRHFSTIDWNFDAIKSNLRNAEYKTALVEEMSKTDATATKRKQLLWTFILSSEYDAASKLLAASNHNTDDETIIGAMTTYARQGNIDKIIENLPKLSKPSTFPINCIIQACCVMDRYGMDRSAWKI